MGRFLDELLSGPDSEEPKILESGAAPQSAPPRPLPAAVRFVVELIEQTPYPFGLAPHAVCQFTADALIAQHWFCRTRAVKVESRGSKDGYRGVLDLVAHPPPDHRHSTHGLPDPILIEFDAASVRKRTLAKLRHYPLPVLARIVVLTRSPPSPPPQGVDVLIGLG